MTGHWSVKSRQYEALAMREISASKSVDEIARSPSQEFVFSPKSIWGITQLRTNFCTVIARCTPHSALTLLKKYLEEEYLYS